MTDSYTRTPAAPDADHLEALLEAVQTARAANTPLRIFGGDTKRESLGRIIEATPLSVAPHTGVTNYEPTELVLTARAGTPLVELQAVTAAQGQTLAFEPALFHGSATLGGALACNLSGPARPWAGSIRDHVLGVSLINGRGEHLSFGGRVMKNVAGYDVSRAQAGALGTLGIITEVSLKVMPLPEATATLRYECTAESAITLMNQRAGEPKPLTGACWYNGQLFLRLSGAASAVANTVAVWGGEQLDAAAAPWAALREGTLPFFAGNEPLWRLSVSPAAPVYEPGQPTLMDWGGAQRWLRGAFTLCQLQTFARTAGGHATLYRGGNRQSDVRATPTAVEQRLHQRLKHAFDPEGILNPGRLYSWL